MDPRIKTILGYAVMAPSGDNCQPWRVVADGLKIKLFNDPEQDTSLYNLKQRASLIAHGAFLENIDLAAPSVGLQAQFLLFPDPDNLNHVATIQFSDGKREKSDSFNAIPLRHTNREKYRHIDIPRDQFNQWQRLAEGENAKIWVGNHDEQINFLSGLLSLNDRLVFEVPGLHQFLFEQIRWSDADAEKTGDGLDIKTLGLNTIDRFSFRFLKNWSLVSLLNRLGFGRIIQFKAKQLLKSSSAFAIITINGTGSADYLQGGRLWQRLLLRLTAEGLTAQPIAGLACLMQAAHEGLLENKITENQLDVLLRTRRELLKHLESNEQDVLLAIFRIGHGPQVTRALRRQLESILSD